ncbi:MAG: hypothetical protein DIU82_12555 [Bacillota bacterium]|nr:MAG: hypothetical protein DIU82_12555 [Bacillota bacterium]
MGQDMGAPANGSSDHRRHRGGLPAAAGFEEEFNGMPSASAGGSKRVLIVNADDLGLTDGVTEGIVQAWREGVVTSTSAMINMEGAAERVAAVHRAHPELPIGLHVNITAGRPVLPPERVPTLVDREGRFHSIDTIPLHLLRISLDELRAELRAQAERLLETGVRFTHIDYHHHIVVLYTPFYRIVRELAKEFGVPVRQPVPASVSGVIRFPSAMRSSAVSQMMGFALRHPILAARMVRHMTPAAVRRQAELLKRDGVRAPDWFIDGFYGNATVENFVFMLERLPEGISEVVVHPGKADEALRRMGAGYIEEREAELKVLTDPRVREACAAFGVQLASYELLRASPRASLAVETPKRE